jgi:sugar transferase (PEP-CTERM/EpsH1 system associated)
LNDHFDLHVATLAHEPVPVAHVAQLRRHCQRLEVVPVTRYQRWARAMVHVAVGRTATQGAFAARRLRLIIRNWATRQPFHAVLASSSGMVPYLRMPEFRASRKIVDLVDVDSEKWLQYADSSSAPKSWLYRLEGRRLRRLERELLGFADAITLVSEAEANLYRQVCGEGPVYAVTNGVDLDYFTPPANPPQPEQACVFVGAMDYRPNVDGVLWFTDHVWPAVRRTHPTAAFYIVGRDPVPTIRRLGSLPGVIVTGTVPDVRPYLTRAAVVVAPLRIARGVQNKVLEAMAMGRPVVASPEALNGLNAIVGEHVLAPTNAPSWIKALCRILATPDRHVGLGHSARRHVELRHNWQACMSPIALFMASGNVAAA